MINLSGGDGEADRRAMLGGTLWWGGVFALLVFAALAAFNWRLLPHAGWYVLNQQWPAQFTWPWISVLLALWVSPGAWVFRRGGRPVLAAGVIWLGLVLAIVLFDLAASNRGALSHAGWYIANFQLPAQWQGIGGGRWLLFMAFAWLQLAIALSPLSVKRPLLALLLIILLGIIFSADGSFYKWETHRDMLRHTSRFGILACGMTLVIITGGIDLAVGSILGLVAVVSAILSIHMGVSPLVAVPLCLMVGVACGTVSGTLVARFQMQPFIATLAMMVFARGLAKLVSGGEKISRSAQAADGEFVFLDMPPLYTLLNARMLGGNIAVVTLILLACLAVSWLLLARLRPGRYLYATGGNEAAARLSGVPVGWAKVLAYAMSGLFAAVAGICQAAQETQGDPNAGETYELTAIAIVVIGGTNLMGGRGGIFLTLLGTLTIGYLEKILSINAVDEAGRLMLTGAIIATAVLLQRRRA